jgi:hypothetical protein
VQSSQVLPKRSAEQRAATLLNLALWLQRPVGQTDRRDSHTEIAGVFETTKTRFSRRAY